jgi:outer membrane protein assembly factor BamB
VKLGKRVSAPVVARGRVYVSLIDEHQIVCLDAEKGEEILWRYSTDSRVDTPPTIHDDLCIFGCHSGWVVCLKAETGELVWKFRAAPYEKRIMYFGQLYSPWPVIGSVLVKPDEDKVFFAAGYHSEMDGGIYVYALNCHTGEVLWERVFRSEGPRFKKDPATGKFIQIKLREITGARRFPTLASWRRRYYLQQVDDEKWFFISGGLYKKKPGTAEVYWLTDAELAASPEKAAWETWDPAPLEVGYPHWIRVWDYTMNDLLVAGRNGFNVKNWLFYYRHGLPVFNRGGSKIRSLPCGSGFLLNQGEWRFGTRNPEQYEGLGRPLVYDERRVYGADIKKKLQHRFDVIGGITRIFAANSRNVRRIVWSVTPREKIWVKGMVVTENALFVADVRVRGNYRESILQKEKGEIRVFSLDRGREVLKFEIPGAPIFDGLIAAQGRLYVSTMNGRVMCIGEKLSVDMVPGEVEVSEKGDRSGLSRKEEVFSRREEERPSSSRATSKYFWLEGEERKIGKREELVEVTGGGIMVEDESEPIEGEEKLAFLMREKGEFSSSLEREETGGVMREEPGGKVLAEKEEVAEERYWRRIVSGILVLVLISCFVFLFIQWKWRKERFMDGV